MHHNKMKEGVLEEGGPPPLVGFDKDSLNRSVNGCHPSKPPRPLSWSSGQDDVTILSEGGPEQHMGLFSGISMIVGSIIGSGIFTTTGSALEQSGTVGMYLILMTLAGALSIFGGLCYVELGCAMPKSGGEHNYLLKAYGPYVSYIFDWTQSFLALPLGNSYMAYMSSFFLCKMFYLNSAEEPNDAMIKGMACVIMVLITLLNMWSARWAARLSDVLTVLKLLALIVIIGIGFYYLGKGHVQNFQGPVVDTQKTPKNYGTALYYLLFSYGGWNSLNFMISELKKPSKNLPLAIIISLSIVICIYVLVSISYFAILPLSVIMDEKASLAEQVGLQAFQTVGAVVVPLMVILSCVGSTNSSFFFTSRLIASSAEEGVLYPTFMSRFHAKRKTPIPALLMTCVISMAFLIPSNPDILIKMSSFCVWIFFFLTVAGLLVLRYSHPDMNRPFKVLTPIAWIFCLVALWLVIYPFTEMKKNSEDMWAFLLALLLILLPIPIIFWGLRKKAAQSSHVVIIQDEKK